jgi:hypothetical protein
MPATSNLTPKEGNIVHAKGCAFDAFVSHQSALCSTTNGGRRDIILQEIGLLHTWGEAATPEFLKILPGKLRSILITKDSALEPSVSAFASTLDSMLHGTTVERRAADWIEALRRLGSIYLPTL